MRMGIGAFLEKYFSSFPFQKKYAIIIKQCVRSEMDITIGSGPIDAGSIPAGRAIFDDSCYHLFLYGGFYERK